jgi:hypothetical protein
VQDHSIATIAAMLRPRPGGGSAAADAFLFPAVTLFLVFVVLALAIMLVVSKRQRTRGVATRALTPLGLVPRGWGLTGWQSNGAVAGRPLSVVLAPEQRHAPSSLTIEVASGSRFDASIGPTVPASAAWLRSMISRGVEVPVPGFAPRSIHSEDPARAGALTTARTASIQRMLAPLVTGQQRWLFVRRGHVKLQVIGYAWQSLTPESLRADVDELMAIAADAERL